MISHYKFTNLQQRNDVDDEKQTNDDADFKTCS